MLTENETASTDDVIGFLWAAVGQEQTSHLFSELGDTVLSMGELTTTLGARTDFHFLNPQSNLQDDKNNEALR